MPILLFTISQMSLGYGDCTYSYINASLLPSQSILHAHKLGNTLEIIGKVKLQGEKTTKVADISKICWQFNFTDSCRYLQSIADLCKCCPKQHFQNNRPILVPLLRIPLCVSRIRFNSFFLSAAFLFS